MLVIISPAKIQNFKPLTTIDKFTMPQFLKESEALVKILRQKTAFDLSELLEINAKLAQQNVERYFNWHTPFTPQNAKQAVFVFDGEVFRGLDAKSFTEDDYDYAQQHLRLLSGLYGILKPLDLIQPYRLEVSTKIETKRGKDIYEFWGDKISKSVDESLNHIEKPKVVLNLASGEYIKSINRNRIKAHIIDVEFHHYKNDKISSAAVIYIKKARGLMARYVIQHRIEDVEDLKGFNAEGYWFSPQDSTENKFVFIK